MQIFNEKNENFTKKRQKSKKNKKKCVKMFDSKNK